MALVADSQRPKGLLFNAGFARIAKGDGLICLVAVERAQICTSSSAFPAEFTRQEQWFWVVLECVLPPGYIVLTFDDLAVVGRFATL